MAAGNTLLQFDARGGEPPASNYATLDANAANMLVLDFDASTAEKIVFKAFMPQHYAGGSVVVRLLVTSSTATSGTMRFAVAFDRKNSGAALGSDSFAAAKSVDVAAPGTAGNAVYASITFSSTEIDGIVAGDAFRLSVEREAAHANDTMAGDAELALVELQEA
jgi:hypothetical protein